MTKKQKMTMSFLIIPIGMHLAYPWNAIAAVSALVAMFVSLFFTWREMNRYSVLGYGICAVGGVGITSASMGILIGDMSLLEQISLALGLVLMGIFIVGIGSRIQNPEMVTVKSLLYSLLSSCILAAVWLFLLYS
ncbi:hypothetical protein [Azotosporobacter soli]|uniref:hypothetical protein n=1 Tax=Azotosporobacter soli TaxID=3055040 RepID=UPI0031FF2C03